MKPRRTQRYVECYLENACSGQKQPGILGDIYQAKLYFGQYLKDEC